MTRSRAKLRLDTPSQRDALSNRPIVGRARLFVRAFDEAVESMLAQDGQPPSAVGTVAVPLSLLSGEAAGALAAKRALPAGSVASSQPGAGRRTVRGGAGGSSRPPRKEARGDG